MPQMLNTKYAHLFLQNRYEFERIIVRDLPFGAGDVPVQLAIRKGIVIIQEVSLDSLNSPFSSIICPAPTKVCSAQ